LSTATAAPPTSNTGFQVTQLNGQTLEVLTQAEQDFYEKQVADYQAAFSFSNVSDLNDLDRLLADELQSFRISRMLASGRDEDGTLLPQGLLGDLRTAQRGLARDINTGKSALGMSVLARQKDASSVGGYLVELRKRAREQGITRERQLTRALVLMNELKSLVSTFDRSNETERDRLGLQNEKDIVKWVRDYMVPEFDDIDEHFRTHQQKAWVGTL
jgi:hypothetical protein